MGKKNYTRAEISKAKTDALGIYGLLILDSESTDNCFHAVHEHYFSKEKYQCPACHSNKTRSSKVTIRKFKDVLETDDGFQIIDLYFHQRWFRCDNCKNSVFPEDVDFAEKGCRYTNRLADKLADGTFRYSYKKVCNYYGVPASTASVGAIMRRRIQYRESLLPALNTPPAIATVEFDYFRERHSLIVGITNSGIYCMDILPDVSEATYVTFFRQLDANKLKRIYIEPNEELKSAAAICFPLLQPLLSHECIHRHARNAFLEIIHSDGKRFPVVHKDDVLTQNKKYITDEHRQKQIRFGMSSRERLSKGYDQHQKLLEIFDTDWNYSKLSAWSATIEPELNEFGELIDVIEFYEPEITGSLMSSSKLPENFVAVIQGICDAITAMPHCIFDVLRARCMLTISNDTIIESEYQKRLGVPAGRFLENIKKITENIKKEREYEL